MSIGIGIDYSFIGIYCLLFLNPYFSNLVTIPLLNQIPRRTTGISFFMELTTGKSVYQEPGAELFLLAVMIQANSTGV